MLAIVRSDYALESDMNEELSATRGTASRLAIHDVRFDNNPQLYLYLEEAFVEFMIDDC
jgi:hypothetical protein